MQLQLTLRCCVMELACLSDIMDAELFMTESEKNIMLMGQKYLESFNPSISQMF